MATRGRKPTPTAIKILEGNPGKRKINENEPRPLRKAPVCPKWLLPEAKKEWKRLSKCMEELGTLTEIDMAAFAGYCQSYARWKEAEEKITDRGLVIRTPSGYPQQVPYVSISQQNLRLMHQIAAEFGMTPASRSRIIAGQNDKNSTDDMEALLSGTDTDTDTDRDSDRDDKNETSTDDS